MSCDDDTPRSFRCFQAMWSLKQKGPEEEKTV